MHFLSAPDHWGGPYQVAFHIRDDGGTEVGGHDSLFQEIPIQILTVDDPIVVTSPSTMSGSEDTPVVLSRSNGTAVWIHDLDHNGETVEVTLNAAHGTLRLAGTEGLTFPEGNANAAGRMTFTGMLDAINMALDGLAFTPERDFHGMVQLTIDAGYAGDSNHPTQHSDASTDISITPVNDPPTYSGTLPNVVVIEGTASTTIDLSQHFADVDTALSGDCVTFSVVGNTNSSLATARIAGTVLTVEYAFGVTGSTCLTIQAEDGNSQTVQTTVVATVQTGDEWLSAAWDVLAAELNARIAQLRDSLLTLDPANQTEIQRLQEILNAGPPTLAAVALARSRFNEISGRAAGLRELRSDNYQAATDRLVQVSAVAEEFQTATSELQTAFTNASLVGLPEYWDIAERLLTNLQAANVEIQRALSEANAEMAAFLTPVEIDVDLTSVMTIDANREVRGTVTLDDGAGQITFVAPRGNAATSSLQSEVRWTEPPLVTRAADAQSELTIPASIVDWGNGRLEGFSASSVNAAGTMLAGTVSNDGWSTAFVYNMETGTVRSFDGLSRSGSYAAISSDGTRLVGSSNGIGRDGALRLFDAATGTRIGPTYGPEYVSHLAFRPGPSSDVLYGMRYHFTISWMRENGDSDAILTEIWPYFSASESVVAAPQLKRLGPGSEGPGEAVNLYSLFERRALTPIATGKTVEGLALSPDGSLLLTWDTVGAIAVWDTTRTELITTLAPTSSRYISAQFGANGSVLVVADNTGIVREFSVLALRDGGNEPLAQRTISPSESVIVHPQQPEMFLIRTENGVAKVKTVGLSNVETRGERRPAVEARGGGTLWIDTSSVAGAVTKLSFGIVSVPEGTRVRATAFSGRTQISSIEVQPGNEVVFEDPRGISTVDIEAIDWTGPLGITDLKLTVLRSADPVDANPLSIRSNALYARTIAPGPLANPGRALDYRSGPYAIEGDLSKFMLVKVPGGRIAGFNYYPSASYRDGYTDPGEPRRVPSEYIHWIDSSRAILFPNRPITYIDVGGDSIVGTRDGQTGNVMLVRQESDTILDLLPPEGWDIRLTFIDADLPQGETPEGFFRESLTPGVVSRRSPVGGALYSVLRVVSSGSIGGEITAQIFASSDLHPEPVLQKTFPTTIGASDILTLRFVAEMPGHEKSAYAYVRIVDANGNVLAEEGAGHVGRNANPRSPEEIQQDRNRLADAVAQAQVQTVHYWVALGKNPAYAEEARAGLRETLGAMETVLDNSHVATLVSFAEIIPRDGLLDSLATHVPIDFVASNQSFDVRFASLDPSDPQYSLETIVQLLPSETISDHIVRESADRIAKVFEDAGLGSALMTSTVDSEAQAAYASLKTVIVSLQRGQTLEQALASASGIHQMRWGQLHFDLLEGFVTGVVVDITTSTLADDIAAMPASFEIGIGTTGTSITLILNKLFNISLKVAGSFSAILIGVFDNPEQLANDEGRPYLVTFLDRACLVPKIVAIGLPHAVEAGDLSRIVSMYITTKDYYFDLLSDGSITASVYAQHRQLADSFYLAIIKAIGVVA